MRHNIIYIILLLSSPLLGQMSLKSDTIRINEVIISMRKINPDPTGYKRSRIDSSILKISNHSSLADLLAEHTNISIKSYGMGGTATPSLRGTGANHTQVAWNGININHPMLGQSDLSLMPVGLIDEIQVCYGGASMTLNSGGIGGIINLETKPIWKKETLISISPGTGSFGQYSGLVKVKSGSINFQTITKAFFHTSENNFRYLNTLISTDPIWETRKNSQVYQQGFIQEIYLRRTKKIASARIWYQSANRNLPSSMLNQQPNSEEKQFDESVRAMLNYDFTKGRNDFFLTGAWFFNRLNYSNTLASIDSRNLSQTFTLKAVIERRIWNSSILKMTISDEVNVIKSINYDQNAIRNTTSLTTSFERKCSNKLGTMILIRQILDNNTLLIPDFSAGIQFRLIDHAEYFLKANLSRNSKIPTTNDLLWVPGGNPLLKNEYAYTYELTYEMNQRVSSPATINYDLSIFRNHIRDMILWHPGNFSYWTADNIQNVNSFGLESSFSLDYASDNITSRFVTGYSFNRATESVSDNYSDISSGKQLIYVPEHKVNNSLIFGYRVFYTSWVSNFTGKRFITVDNSKSLPAYFNTNITAGVKLKKKDNLIDINFNIDNLLNSDYQTIAYYPLPGRSYSIKLIIQILK